MQASTNHPFVIKDACILFDLLDLGLLPHFYQLPLKVITTPQVIAEIEEPDQMAEVQPYIDNGKLEIDGEGELADMIAIRNANRGLSLTDASVLDAATRRQAGILSSDKSLRSESQRRGYIVRGVLWVLEEMHLRGLLTLEVTLEKLEEYPKVNSRAPKAETIALINRLKQTNP